MQTRLPMGVMILHIGKSIVRLRATSSDRHWRPREGTLGGGPKDGLARQCSRNRCLVPVEV